MVNATRLGLSRTYVDVDDGDARRAGVEHRHQRGDACVHIFEGMCAMRHVKNPGPATRTNKQGQSRPCSLTVGPDAVPDRGRHRDDGGLHEACGVRFC